MVCWLLNIAVIVTADYYNGFKGLLSFCGMTTLVRRSMIIYPIGQISWIIALEHVLQDGVSAPYQLLNGLLLDASFQRR